MAIQEEDAPGIPEKVGQSVRYLESAARRRIQLLKLEATESIAESGSLVITSVIMLVLGSVFLLTFNVGVGFLLSELTPLSVGVSFLILSAFNVAMIALVFSLRERLFDGPFIWRAVSASLFPDQKNKPLGRISSLAELEKERDRLLEERQHAIEELSEKFKAGIDSILYYGKFPLIGGLLALILYKIFAGRSGRGDSTNDEQRHNGDFQSAGITRAEIDARIQTALTNLKLELDDEQVERIGEKLGEKIEEEDTQSTVSFLLKILAPVLLKELLEGKGVNLIQWIKQWTGKSDEEFDDMLGGIIPQDLQDEIAKQKAAAAAREAEGEAPVAPAEPVKVPSAKQED